MKYYLLFILSVFFSFSSYSQNIFFEKNFGSSQSDFGRSVKQTKNGFIYVGGYSLSAGGDLDFALSKLTSTGDLSWTKYYGDNLDNTCLHMNITHDENFILIGETQTSPSNSDILIIKVDKEGNEIWRSIYGSSVNESVKYIEETSDKGFILCGFQNDNFGYNDIYVLKIDPSGGFQWDKAFGSAKNDYSDMIRQTPDKGYIVTADTDKGVGSIIDYDIQVTKLDSSGNIKWNKLYGDSLQNGCQGILVTSAGNYLSYGETNVNVNYSPFDFYIEMLDTSGTSIWVKTFGGIGSDAIFSAVETGDKGFVFTGYSNSYNNNEPIDVVVFKTDSIGNLKWLETYGDSGIDIGYDIIHAANGGFLIAGKTYVNNKNDFYLLNVNQFDGTLSGLNEPVSAPSNLLIYPNPAQTKLFFTDPEITAIQIFSLQGNLLFSGNVYSNYVDINSLASGLYIAVVKTKQNTFSVKLSVIK